MPGLDTVFNLPLLTDRIKASPLVTNGNTVAIPRQIIFLYHTVLSHPVTVFEKKAPPSQWEVELCQKQINTDVGHCNLFQWLRKICTSLRLTPIILGFSQRSGWIMFQISATCSVGAMGAKL